MHRLRTHRADLLALLLLFVLPLFWFGPVLVPALSGYTLLPYDNLYSFEPWQSLHPGLIPHNNLLSDLVLENAVWKHQIRRTLAEGQLPLWNPQILTGLPFLAAGQASTFYPLSILFLVLPLEMAYGWFTAVQIGLAGANTYIFGRTLRLRPLPALLSGVIFMLSGFLMVSVVFTMFVAAAVWLPLLLAVIELVIRKQEEKGAQSFRPIPYLVCGAMVIGCLVLAGHPELIYYTLLVAGAYGAVRLVVAERRLRRGAEERRGNSQPASRILKLAGWLLVMAVLGVATGAIQLLPLLELLPLNFREGSVSLAQVRAWAWPSRHVLTFFLPDVFGNPSHHHWFDLWSWQWVPATINTLGEPVDTIFWGIKNYVEGGNYLGIGTWLLAAIAIGAILIPRSTTHEWQVTTWFFTILALLSLLFAFGTPLYAILFYGLPGWDQLHSPFRWVFPFTLSMAMLAGIGLQALTAGGSGGTGKSLVSGLQSFSLLFAGLACLAGLGAVALVVISFFLPSFFIGLGQRIVQGSDLTQMAFSDGRMFWSYEALGLARFGLFALLGGLSVWSVIRGSRDAGARKGVLSFLLIMLVAVDLYAAHGAFNPSSPVELSPLNPENIPPVVKFLNDREAIELPPASRHSSQPWRFTTFNLPGEKTLNANVGMYYGWQDVRGYDSIIPRHFAQFMERIAPQGDLLYNRIAPLYSNPWGETYATLDDPLLDLLNVKYVLTEHYIPNPGWREIYRDDALGVYENQEVLARAFIVPEARVAPVDEQPLRETDLRRTVFIEETPSSSNALTPASPQLADAQISRYTANDLFIDVNLSDRGWLVLTDGWFPGWKAYIRPFGGDESQEEEVPIYRANGTFRAVYLPQDGQWTVRFVYTPMSFKLGLYISFIAAMTLLLLLLWWAWGRYYQPGMTVSEVRTVAKNSLVPMALSLANKAIDFAFAMLYVRLLGPEGTGKYYFVVAIYGFFEIVSRYGLGMLLTRDVAADKNQSSRYLTNVLSLRVLLWLASLPVLTLVTYAYSAAGTIGFGIEGIGVQEVQAIAILALAMLFANWADGLSSMFSAFEKMEYPAGLASAVALLKVTLGAIVLLLGWGFVGLAGVSLVMNILQLFWLYGLMRRTLFQPEWRWDWSLQWWMVRTSGPLMINHLLATLFWRIDIWILRPMAGATAVGLYSVGIKYLDGLNIIPSIFAMAVFPLMSRYARDENGSRANLLRSYTLSLRLLLMISLPIAMMVTFVAEPLVRLVGGVQFLHQPETIHLWGREITYVGGASLALQVIIWSTPIGFVNSVTQFALIAVHQQHYLTKAFIIGVVFNVVGNLLVIPGYGYIGAAIITILSEFSLLFPFYYSVKRNVGVVPWWSLLRAPLISVAVMGTVIYALIGLGLNAWLAVLVGWMAYVVALALTGGLSGEDMAIVWRALPMGPLRRVLPVGG